MPVTLDQLGRTLQQQLSAIVNGGDANVPAPTGTFMTWCTPGIAFEPANFDFAAGGLAAPTAEEAVTRLRHAFEWAQLVDFVPNLSTPFGREAQEFLNRPSQHRLSHVYGEALRFSKVAKQELTPEQQAKLEKFRGLLRRAKKVVNPFTDEETEVMEEGPAQLAYTEKMAKYYEALTKYNQKRIAAETAKGENGVAAVLDWSANAQGYWAMVTAARDAWVSGGFKNEVEMANGFIDQVTRRSMVLWKKGLLEDLDKAKLDATTPGSTFRFTSVVPGNFATSGGWTSYSMYHEQAEANTSSETTSWSVGGNVNWGLWSFGADVSHSESTATSDFSTSSFTLSMELTPVMISRPWFVPEFLPNRGWKLDSGGGVTVGQLSDGGNPPQGDLVGYSTMALFARNIVVESSEFATAYSESQSRTDVSGSVGWGPFSLSGSYGHGETASHWESERSGGAIRVPGMQLIGFVNQLVGRSPNPDPDLTDADFE